MPRKKMYMLALLPVLLFTVLAIAPSPAQPPQDVRVEQVTRVAAEALPERETGADEALSPEQELAALRPVVTTTTTTTTTLPPTTTTTTTAAPRGPPAVKGSTYGMFVRLADCESGERDRHGNIIPGSANWSANTGNGYYGGLQFSAATWRQAGGSGLPHQHSMNAQIALAQSWLAKTSWAQWPTCSRNLGYR